MGLSSHRFFPPRACRTQAVAPVAAMFEVELGLARGGVVADVCQLRTAIRKIVLVVVAPFRAARPPLPEPTLKFSDHGGSLEGKIVIFRRPFVEFADVDVELGQDFEFALGQDVRASRFLPLEPVLEGLHDPYAALDLFEAGRVRRFLRLEAKDVLEDLHPHLLRGYGCAAPQHVHCGVQLRRQHFLVSLVFMP